MKAPIFFQAYKYKVLLMTTSVVPAPFAQANAIDNLTTLSGDVVTAGSATFDRPA